MTDSLTGAFAAAIHSDTYSPHGSLYGGPGCTCQECRLDCRCEACVLALLEELWLLASRDPCSE
jgi:hypothetical protein